jgi:hypothetical protein
VDFQNTLVADRHLGASGHITAIAHVLGEPAIDALGPPVYPIRRAPRVRETMF